MTKTRDIGLGPAVTTTILTLLTLISSFADTEFIKYTIKDVFA